MSSLDARHREAHQSGPFEAHAQPAPQERAAPTAQVPAASSSTEQAAPRSAEQQAAAGSVMSHWADSAGPAPAADQETDPEGEAEGADHHEPVATAASTRASASGGHHGGVKGGHRNVDMAQANLHNRDHYSKGGMDPNRFTLNGHRLHLKEDSPIMADNGQQLGTAHRMRKVKKRGGGHTFVKQAVRINAGEIRDVTPEAGGPSQTCVFIFSVDGHSGWVNVHAFENAPELAKAQRAIKGRLSDLRGEHEDAQHGGAGHKVRPSDAPSEIDKLFTLPHQTTANHAHDYYQRPGGVVNLLINLPGTDQHRVGVAGDVIAAGADFHRVAGVGEERCYLWTKGQHGHKTEHYIPFVYGYITRPGQEKRFGWINKHMVPGL